MAVVFMTDPDTGRCALYDENGTTGNADDPNSTRNAPLNNPATHLDKIYFHSDFDYMEVSHGPTVATINHSAVSASGVPAGATIAFGWGTASADHLLLTHSLGYVPQAMVIYDGNLLWPGMPVQVDGSGGSRFVSFYVTTTAVRLYETASTGAGTLSSVSRDYTVLVFKAPPAPSGDVLMDFDPGTGSLSMGKGKFDSLRRYLQVVAGGSPFGIAKGRTIDLNNGAPRAVRPDGTVVDTVPASLAIALSRTSFSTNWGAVYGGDMNYLGSYAGPGSILVQAP